jgi:hypothetical protein
MSEKRVPSAYERRQIELIERWMQSPPSYATRGFRAAKGAAGSFARRVLPNGTVEKFGARFSAVGAYAQRVIPTGAIEGAINANIWVAHRWTRETAILKKLGIADFEDIKHLDLENLDALANNTHNLAVGMGGAAGAAGGAGGLLFALPSVAAIINLTMRTTRQIGLCYGFHRDDHIERACLLEVLSLVGGAGDQGAKLASTKLLQETLVMINRQSFKSMAEKAATERALKEAFITNIREVAKGLGFRLTRSRLQTAIPLVGGGVGLLLDGNYMRSVGWTARHYYQRRGLQERGRWPETIETESDPAGPSDVAC